MNSDFTKTNSSGNFVNPTAVGIYNYWRKLCKGNRPANRFDIDPNQLSYALPKIFILEKDRGYHFRYRIAGSTMSEIIGKQLRHRSFFEFWNHLERETIEMLMANLCSGAFIGNVSGSAWAGSDRLAKYHIMLLPLHYDESNINRMLGFFTMDDNLSWVGNWPVLKMTISELSLTEWSSLDSEICDPLDLTKKNNVAKKQTGKSTSKSNKANLTIIDGGLA